MPRFTPDFLDELKARLRPSDVIGRYVKLKKQGNEWAGLSPFTNEKTPSFFVNDQKGFFHCFSSQKHGDIISFLQETQKLAFHEAVERLAEEAGMPLPVESPQDRAREEQARGLSEACAAAAGFYSAQLRRSAGRHALDYLYGRDVRDDKIKAFNIGYAPGGRADLKDFLINKGFAESVLVEAGLIIKPDDGGASYDRFRNRVMFPILGGRDRVIAFGGRALDANARAKYLNSPETPLFRKSNVLYNLASARSAAADDKAALIVCEGYMDVIALWGAGIKRAVAPLGTAMTEAQIALLWRASDEPVLCFDGDRAGTGAAHRAIDRALALLKPGKSLRFAFLPQGQDPDDLLRAEGRAAMDAVLAAAQPLVDVLWDREVSSRELDTPERRAALRAHLRELVKAIADPDVRNAYGQELSDRLDRQFAKPKPAFQPRRGGENRAQRPRAGFGGGFQRPAPRPSEPLKRRGAPSPKLREAAIVMGAITHPSLVERFETEFFGLELTDSSLQQLLSAALSAISASPGLDSDALKSHLTQTGEAGVLERTANNPELLKHRFLRPDAEIEEVEAAFSDVLNLHLFGSLHQREVALSASHIFSDGEETWKAATAAREDLKTANRDAGEATDDGGGHGRLQKALERMRQSVDERFNR